MRNFLVIWFVLFVYTLPAQTGASTSIDSVSSSSIYTGPVNNFAADNLGNFYIVTQGGLLKKLNNKGDSLNVFNDVRRYGTISLLDVTNPLKILLYYKDFSTVVMLDRFMNRINTIDFRKAGIFQSKAVGLSYDNNLWIYDEQSAKLKKISDDGKLMSETVDLRQVLTVMPSPEKIIDRDGFVYLYDPAKGLYVFDYYGVLKNELPLINISDIQVIGTTIVGRSNKKFVRYTLGSLDLQEAILPPAIEKADKICIMQQAIYILGNNGIEIFPYR